MEYVATNIRLPRPLWLHLKRVAAERGQRMAVVIREWLERGAAQQSTGIRASAYKDPLCGALPKRSVPDKLLTEAKQLFTRRRLPT